MNFLRTYAAVLALLVAAPASAQWQVPQYSVPTGRGGGVTGFDNAAPGTAGLPIVSNGPTAKPAFGPVANNGIQPGAANTFKGSLNGSATSDIALTACTLSYQITKWVAGTGWQCGLNPVLPSRAIAATLDLSAFTSVKTLGHTTPGDGGDATLVKIGSAPFKDTYVLTGSVTAGSGYTNGTYLGVRLTSGSGIGCLGKVTVAGAVVTAVDISGNYCVAYAVGDVLTITQSDVGGTGTGAAFTIATISTPLGSFTDTAANRWQITVGGGAWPNVKQFGAKIDWAGTDATATNDLLSFKSAIAFANVQNAAAAAFVTGTKLLMPTGAALLCDGGTPFQTLNIPQGVALIGAGASGGSTLVQCTASNSSVHFTSLCDPNAQFGQFGCALKDLSLYSPGVGSGGTYAIYSNSGQQFPLVDNVFIVTATRGCIFYEIGKGGAANAIFENFDCERSSTSPANAGMLINSSNTQVVVRNANFGCAPVNCAAGFHAINKQAGNLVADTVHIEQHVDAVGILTASTDLNTLRNFTIGSGCVNGITLGVLNPNNTVLVENIQSGCSTATVLNSHAAGVNVTGNIMAQRVFNP